jgi:hypothetical protein
MSFRLTRLGTSLSGPSSLFLCSLMTDPGPDPSLHDQALNLLRNLACADAADIEMVVHGIGEARLFELLEAKLWSSREETVLQVRKVPRASRPFFPLVVRVG